MRGDRQNPYIYIARKQKEKGTATEDRQGKLREKRIHGEDREA